MLSIASSQVTFSRLVKRHLALEMDAAMVGLDQEGSSGSVVQASNGPTCLRGRKLPCMSTDADESETLAGAKTTNKVA